MENRWTAASRALQAVQAFGVEFSDLCTFFVGDLYLTKQPFSKIAPSGLSHAPVSRRPITR
jgi:hypothetical protein